MGVVGGVVSAIVMLTLVELGEMLPAASRAATVYAVVAGLARLGSPEPATAAVRPMGVVGGVVSAIVMLTLVELGEMLPAASRAATLSLHVVLPNKPVSAKLVVTGVATCTPLR